MVHDPESRIRLGFHGRDIHVLLEAGVQVEIVELIAAVGSQFVRPGHRDHQVGLPDMPLVWIAELPGRRHVGGIAKGRSLIDPIHNGRNLGVGQRRIILELGDAHVAVDVPRRHLPEHDLFLDRARPRPRVLVGQQRHGRDRPIPMAVLTGALQNGRHILSERDGSFAERHRLNRAQREGTEQDRSTCPHDDLPRSFCFVLAHGRH